MAPADGAASVRGALLQPPLGDELDYVPLDRVEAVHVLGAAPPKKLCVAPASKNIKESKQKLM